MSQRAVLVLAALVAMLVGYILVFERTSPTSKELHEREGKVLTTFVRDRVERLELQRKDKWVVLERKKLETGDFGSWKLLEPAAGEADQDAVDQVLGELEWLSARRTLENVSAADAKAFGLDAPRFRIAYGIGGQRHVLAVGKPDVHEQGVYVRVQGEPNAYVVPKTLVEAVDQAPGHYRSKQFLGDLTIAWARDVELDLPSAKVHLQQVNDRWWYEGEPRSYADAKRVEDLLAALNDLRATRYVEAGPGLDAAQKTLAAPTTAVRVRVVPDTKREDQEPRLIDLRLGGSCPDHPSERLARAGEKGPVVCVGEDSLKLLQGEPVSFRQATLFGLDPSQIEAFTLTSAAHKLTLKRDGEKWSAAGAAQPDREAVEQWLHDLSVEKARAFLAPGAGSSGARLTLTLAGGKESSFAIVGTAPDRNVLVRRDQEPVVLAFRGELAQLLEPAPDRFASLEPWATHQPSEVAGFEAHAEGLRRALSVEQGRWQSAPNQPLAPDADLRVRELVKTLMKLRVRAFVADHPSPEHGLASPHEGVVLHLKDAKGNASGELRLEIGAESEHGAYARLDGKRVVEVTRTTIAQIRELAGGTRELPAAEPDAGSEQEGEHEDHEHFH